MQLLKPFFFILLVINDAYTQSLPTEFEGRVHYRNTFIIKDPGIDSADLVNNLGSSSTYIYKAGKFLWVAHGSDFQYEVYDSESGLLYDKYASSDTLQFIDIFKKHDSIIAYKIIRNADTICGYTCHLIEMEIQSQNDGSIMKRKIFYSPELYVNPEYFRNYRSYANHQVYKLTRSIALRLVTEYHGFPVVVIINAEKVEIEKVPDSEFKTF